MILKSSLIPVLIILLLTFSKSKFSVQRSAVQWNSSFSDSSITAGRKLFENCKGCHSINNAVVGPALGGVQMRWSSNKKLYQFMINPFPFFRNDKYVKDLVKKYDGLLTPAFKLSYKEFECILDFIKSEEKK